MVRIIIAPMIQYVFFVWGYYNCVPSFLILVSALLTRFYSSIDKMKRLLDIAVLCLTGDNNYGIMHTPQSFLQCSRRRDIPSFLSSASF